jgi:hypothetical protein
LKCGIKNECGIGYGAYPVVCVFFICGAPDALQVMMHVQNRRWAGSTGQLDNDAEEFQWGYQSAEDKAALERLWNHGKENHDVCFSCGCPKYVIHELEL